MRITSNGLQRQTLESIRNAMSGLAEAQRRVSTGKRVHAPSDDPQAADGILRTARRSRALEQYARNIDTAESRLRAEESALEGVTNLLTRAKELGVMARSGTLDSGAREAIALEVDALREAAIDLANTGYGDGYLFGGTTPDVPPADPVTGAIRPEAASGGHQLDIGGSGWFTTNHDASEIFGQPDVIGALESLSDAVRTGDSTDVGTALSGVDTAFDEIQVRFSEVGARTNRLEIARANVEALDLNLQTLRSDLEDVEIEEAVSELVGRQMAYQSALLAASKIMSTTLTDYLR